MNAPKIKTQPVLHAASLALSILLTVLIFGSVALGLTWDAGSPTSLRMADPSEQGKVRAA
jgi:hypothetical protein